MNNITEHEQLEKKSAFFEAIIQHTDDAIISKTVDGIITSWNRGAEEIFGYSAEEMIGQSLIQLLPADRQDEEKNILERLKNGENIRHFETIRVRKDKTEINVSVTISPMYDCNQNFIGYSKIARNITEQKQILQRLELAASVFSTVREGIFITDSQGVILEANESFSYITGYSYKEVIGKNPRLLQSGKHPPEFYTQMWESLVIKGHWYGEVWNRRKDGSIYIELLNISCLRDSHGVINNYIAIFTDISPIKNHELQLEKLAHYDPLTQLPNRVLFADRLSHAINLSERNNEFLAVVYIDLDGFKQINDHHGHEVGDKVLIAIAQNMQGVIREGDTLARIGGDEFMAVIVGVSSVRDCEHFFERLLKAASKEVTIDTSKFLLSASIGVSIYPEDSVEADALIRYADQAMYLAKQSGKNRYHLFDSELDKKVKVQNEMRKHIQNAIVQNEFVLYYQPKVNMRTRQIVGAEALIRWQRPNIGLISPNDFLPIIENDPISVELGEWVINTALNQLSKWQAVGLDTTISVNIGSLQLMQANFVERISAILENHPNILSSRLELEILETSALEDIKMVSSKMIACREMGLRFALDDFGTGYSSLAYLKHLPAELLKIDQVFIRDMLDDPDDLAIVQGVIGLATAFKRQVIAEGVETVAHITHLLSLGCELGQGYGIARPMPATDLTGWVAQWEQDGVEISG